MVCCSNMDISPKIILSASAIAFIAHTGYNLLENLNISQTLYTEKIYQFKDIPFPVLFKFMVFPAFNMSYLKESGYSTIFDYFCGATGPYNNRSFIGWRGQNKTDKASGGNTYLI